MQTLLNSIIEHCELLCIRESSLSRTPPLEKWIRADFRQLESTYAIVNSAEKKNFHKILCSSARDFDS